MWQKIRFFWERLNGLKIPIYVIVAFLIFWLVIPTGDPTDLISIPLYQIFGVPLMLIVGALSLIIVLLNKNARKMFKSPTSSEVSRICKKITETKSGYKKCLTH